MLTPARLPRQAQPSTPAHPRYRNVSSCWNREDAEISRIKPSERTAAITTLLTTILDMPIAACDFFEDCTLRVAEATGWTGGNIVPRNLALCSWILLPLRPECLVINDLSADGRFKEHPGVAEGPKFRFYAGAPLLTDTGYRLGTLYVGAQSMCIHIINTISCRCVMDYKPRSFTAEACMLLCNYADMVVSDLERFLNLTPQPVPAALLQYSDVIKVRRFIVLPCCLSSCASGGRHQAAWERAGRRCAVGHLQAWLEGGVCNGWLG